MGELPDNKTVIKRMIIVLGVLVVLISFFYLKSEFDKKREKEIGTIINNAMSGEENKESEVDIKEDNPEYVDGFEKAEYEMFNSYASENGLGGKKIYVDGVVKEKIILDNQGNFILEQEKGENWIVCIGTFPVWNGEHIDDIIGKTVRVYGEYIGFSDKMKMPGVHILDEDLHFPEYFVTLLDENGNETKTISFLSSEEQIAEWYDENSSEIIYSEYTKQENQDTYKMSTGVILNISKYKSCFIDFLQKTDNGYELRSITIESMLLSDNSIFDDFHVGDGIRLYYYIASNGISYLTADKVDLDFSLDDYILDFKKKCSDYTYEGMARNPENVRGECAKVTGKVIQVIESGNNVTMRVNITKSKYGNYSDTVYVTYKRKSQDEDRILEDDIITIYGTLSGMQSYTSVIGSEVSLPKISADYIEISN